MVVQEAQGLGRDVKREANKALEASRGTLRTVLHQGSLLSSDLLGSRRRISWCPSPASFLQGFPAFLPDRFSEFRDGSTIGNVGQGGLRYHPRRKVLRLEGREKSHNFAEGSRRGEEGAESPGPQKTPVTAK